MNITAVTLLRNKELVNCCSYSAQVFPSSMESFSRTTQLAYGKNISWVKILVMLLQLLQFSLLEIHPLTPKDTYIVLHGARFKLLTKQCCDSQLWPFLYSPAGGFFMPPLTSVIMVGFNTVGRNVVHSVSSSHPTFPLSKPE